MGEFAIRFVEALWMLLLDAGIWLVVGFILAGVVHVLVPADLLARHLSGDGVWSIAKASLLGLPLPLCSCSVIPVAAGLRGSGASKGASAAFAISTPQTGEESVPLTWALFGPVYAITRPILAVATAFAAGMLIEAFGDGKPRSDGETERRSEKKACCSSEAVEGFGEKEEKPRGDEATEPQSEKKTCCSSKTQQDKQHESGSASSSLSPSVASSLRRFVASPLPHSVTSVLRYGLVTMMRDLGPWLAIGLLLSAVISAVVPPGWIESNIGTGLVPMLMMLLVGLPLYVCATSTTPLAYTLVVAGLSPGAALVLLMAGPATNAATMSWVLKDLGVRALVIYLATIAAFAVAGGLAFDSLLRGTIRLAEQGIGHEHSAISLAQSAGAVVFTVLLVWALAARYWPSRGKLAGK